MSPVVLKAMKKGNLKSFVSGERSRALWALLFFYWKFVQLCLDKYIMYWWLFTFCSDAAGDQSGSPTGGTVQGDQEERLPALSQGSSLEVCRAGTHDPAPEVQVGMMNLGHLFPRTFLSHGNGRGQTTVRSSINFPGHAFPHTFVRGNGCPYTRHNGIVSLLSTN